jgi:hypothetical protein
MKKLICIIFIWTLIIQNGFSQTQNAGKTADAYTKKKEAALAQISSAKGGNSSSDCAGSIVLCGGIYTEESAPPGTGNTYEFTGTCNQGTETMSLWYTFTVEESGTISFVIDPAVDADDYDWGLFNITNGGCAGIIAQDGSSPEVGCNSYGSLVMGNGPTGISTANGGVGTSNGPGDTFGPAFNADLQVDSGQTFALVVMNWSNSNDGYTIDFTQSTASIYDATVPEVISVVTQCGNQNFDITFSEALLNTSVQLEDFSITGPDGNTIPFSSVSSADTSAYSQTNYTLSLDSGLTVEGTYTISITNISGNVEDICGNLAVDTSFLVNIIAPVSYDISITNACNGINGSIEASYLNGGTFPISFEIDDVLLDEESGSGLDSGLYVIKVIDGTGCEIERDVLVPNHDIVLSISELQDSLSCANPEVQIQGVEILPAQTTEFLWNSLTSNGSDSLFSQVQNPTTSLPGVYTLYVTEATSGCRDSASVIIEESELAGIDLKTLQFPNVISANGDGKNDSWRPYLPSKPDFDVTEIFDTYSLIIFNRWGIPVFDSQKEGTKYWITSSETTAGMYYYAVAYKSDCGTIIDDSKQGSILVIK